MAKTKASDQPQQASSEAPAQPLPPSQDPDAPVCELCKQPDDDQAAAADKMTDDAGVLLHPRCRQEWIRRVKEKHAEEDAMAELSTVGAEEASRRAARDTSTGTTGSASPRNIAGQPAPGEKTAG